MISYILQVTICWLIFYLLYRFLFARLSFFQVNRFILLGLLLLGLIVPRVERPKILQAVSVDEPAVDFTQNLSYDFVHVNTVVDETVQSLPFDWSAIIMVIYLLGVLLMSVRLLRGILHIARLYLSGDKIVDRGLTTVFTRQDHRPFSFFHCLFLSHSDRRVLDGDMIKIHEKQHMDQRHSLDILFVEILLIIFWCSPMIHLYRTELRRVHEFSADAAVLQRHRLKDYRTFLLQELQPGLTLSLGNPFFSSQIKHRITMMQRTPSYRINYLRYFSLVPVALVVSLHFGYSDTHAGYLFTSQQQDNTDHTTIIERDEDGALQYWVEIYGDIEWDETEKHFLHEADSVVVKSGWEMISQLVQVEEMQDIDAARYLMTEHLRHGESHIVKLNRDGGFQLRQIGAEKFNINTEFISIHTRSIDPEIVSKECPHFPGCEMLLCSEDCVPMLKFVYKAVRYPKESRQNLSRGLVVAKFIVAPSGAIENIAIVRSVDEYLDAEVIRVIKTMPKWTPRFSDASPISSTLLLPVLYRLDGLEGNEGLRDSMRNHLLQNYLTQGIQKENAAQDTEIGMVDIILPQIVVTGLVP